MDFELTDKLIAAAPAERPFLSAISRSECSDIDPPNRLVHIRKGIPEFDIDPKQQDYLIARRGRELLREIEMALLGHRLDLNDVGSLSEHKIKAEDPLSQTALDELLERVPQADMLVVPTQFRQQFEESFHHFDGSHYRKVRVHFGRYMSETNVHALKKDTWDLKFQKPIEVAKLDDDQYPDWLAPPYPFIWATFTIDCTDGSQNAVLHNL